MLKDIRIGLISRCDKSGLGAGQTLRLARLLKPDKIMLIDSTPFNGAEQYPEWYSDTKWLQVVHGFPNEEQIKLFLKELDVVISCETFYSNQFVDIAKANNVKTILIFNYEFNDYLQNPSLTLPDKMIQPSYWYLDEMKARFNAEYLPTPIFEDEFEKAREINFKRSPFVDKRKYLFLNGKSAAHDRAGLESLYEALQLAKGDFEVVVKAQGEVKKHPDPRLTYDFSNPDEQWKLYAGFDAMVHPRRYGGQSLPMTEALSSALPVIMLDIDPNNKILPKGWLVDARRKNQFMTRTLIDIYNASSGGLAESLDVMSVINFKDDKQRAYKIGQQYEAENLREQYMELLI